MTVNNKCAKQHKTICERVKGYRFRVNAFYLTLILLSAWGLCCQPAMAKEDIPHLEKRGTAIQLIRKGKPFVMLSGELHNSSSSTPIALRSSMQTAKAMGMNSVIATISWEQFEPEEGKYDYSQIDTVLKVAEEYDMPLGIIWFAGYKNGESSYAPVWVKKDTKRFPRVLNEKGENTTTLSPLYKNTMEADGRAYRKLMERIREKDQKQLVCIMQVENEMGAFVDIDHSSEARKAFEGQVPTEVMKYLQKNEKTLTQRMTTQWVENGKRKKGTWKEVFGDNEYAKQFFISWAFARYAECVTKYGKEAYPIPMYVNCWLAGEKDRVGSYPNGGPRAIALDLYKAAAPSIDLLAPDIYMMDFRSVIKDYKREDNPIFIPEVNRTGTFAYYAFGEGDAICYSPFGFEEAYDDADLIGEYKTLGEILPEIAEAQGTGRMHGFVRQPTVDSLDCRTTFQLGEYTFNVRCIRGEKNAHGLAIQTGKDEFLVAGLGGYITFECQDKNKVCKIAYAEELQRNGDSWETLFVLNGDETAHNNMLYLRGRMPNPDFTLDGTTYKGPLYRPSYQRMDNPKWTNRYKVSGIYRIKLYTYPTSPEHN